MGPREAARTTCSARPEPRASEPPPRSTGPGPSDGCPGLSSASFWLLWASPNPNCLQICKFKGAGTQLGRALGPWGPPRVYGRASGDRATRARSGAMGPGSELGPRTPDPAASGTGAAFPARAQRNCQGTAQTQLGQAGLGRRPQGLWAQGTSPRATSEADAGGSTAQTLAPRPWAPTLSPPGRARPPTPPRTWEPMSPRPGGAAGSGARPGPRTPPWYYHSESLSSVKRPQPDLLRALQTPNALHPRPASRLGPAGAGHRRGRAPSAQGAFPKARKWKLCEKNPQIRPGRKPTGLHKAPGALPPARGLPASG